MIKLPKILVSGGALIYALVISVIVFLLIIALWLKFETAVKVGSKNLRTLQAVNYFQNCDSLIASGVEFSFFNEFFNSDTSSLEIKPWGAWSVCNQNLILRSDTFNKVYLVGSIADSLPNLRVTNSSEGLGLLGNSGLEGWIELETPKVYPAFVGTQYFKGEKVLNGTVTEIDKNETEELTNEFHQNIHEFLKNQDDELDSLLLSDWLQWGNETLFRSFKSSALVLYSDEPFQLDECFIKGQVIIVSNESIEISEKTVLEDVIIIAPRIIIKSNSKVRAQMFASHQIILGNNVTCQYPSAICLISGSNFGEKDSKIEINRESNVNGYVAIIDQANAELLIEQGSVINGLVDSKVSVNMKGDINGHLFVPEFINKIKGGVYKNIISDIRLKPLKFEMIFPFKSSGNGKVGFIQLLP